VDFEDYLISKKIDGPAFKKAEPELFETWKTEFQQVHVNSFTMQKLNLINPIRRKYMLAVTELPPPPPVAIPSLSDEGKVTAKPAVTKPMIKPKPKIN
jgi:hypothetical protein